MAGSGQLKSAKKKKARKKVTKYKQTSIVRAMGNHMMNASQEQIFHNFGTGLTLLYSSHPASIAPPIHSICIFSFIYPLN